MVKERESTRVRVLGSQTENAGCQLGKVLLEWVARVRVLPTINGKLCTEDAWRKMTIKISLSISPLLPLFLFFPTLSSSSPSSTASTIWYQSRFLATAVETRAQKLRRLEE